MLFVFWTLFAVFRTEHTVQKLDPILSSDKQVVSIFVPGDGRIYSSRNFVSCLEYQTMDKSRNPSGVTVICHRQNSLERIFWFLISGRPRGCGQGSGLPCRKSQIPHLFAHRERIHVRVKRYDPSSGPKSYFISVGYFRNGISQVCIFPDRPPFSCFCVCLLYLNSVV